jgi:hypothetical protein
MMNDRMPDKVLESWIKFTNPETLRRNLVLASLYISAYESLKDAIIDPIRNFFATEYVNGKSVESEQYKQEIKQLHGKIFLSSCLWLQRMDAITVEDFGDIKTLTDHRNDLVHELTKYIIDIDHEINLKYLEKIRHLIIKIDRWWICEFEIQVNPDLNGSEIMEEQIRSGRMILMDVIIKTALDSISAKDD